MLLGVDEFMKSEGPCTFLFDDNLYLFAHYSGGSWRSPHAGGGSGGSIWIETELFDGDGAIDAGGGEGYSGSAGNHGGGGAGGRVAIYYTNNNFIGIVLSNFKFNINFNSKTYIKKESLW